MLQSSTYAPVDSKKPRPQHITINALKPPREPGEMRGPVMRRLRRRDSISSSHQERALEQVFAKPFKGRTRSDKSDMVDSWVSSMLSTSPPMDDDGLSRGNSTRQHNRSRGIRPGHRGQLGTPQHARLPRRDFSMSRSARSDPEDFASGAYKEPLSEADDDDINTVDDDADNEENNEENSADEAETNADSVREAPHATTLRLRGFPKTSALTGPSSVFDSSPQLTRDTLAALQPPPPPRRPLPSNFHERNESTNTILFSPIKHKPVSEDDSPSSRKKGNGGYSDRKPPGARPRPIIGDTRQATDLTALADLADDNEANFRMLPSSFATQMAMANSVESGMNKLMLAKIGALEEGIKDIKDILGDVKKMRKREAKLSREA